MAQQFIVVGKNAYRDAMDAVADENFDRNNLVKTAFETTQVINDFFHVGRVDQKGSVYDVTFVRKFSEIEETFGSNAVVAYQKISVFPFQPRKKRKDAKAEAAAA